MASITVRNIDEDLKQRLKEQAARNGCSMEEEVRRILAEALPYHKPPPEALGTAIYELFKHIGGLVLESPTEGGRPPIWPVGYWEAEEDNDCS